MTRKDAPSLIEKLTAYYEEKKILSTNFDCPHSARCRKGRNDPSPMKKTREDAANVCDTYDTFTPAKSALVGKYYEHANPRLLFVSSDAGSAIYITHSFASPQSRTPKSLQHHPKFQRDKMNDHWRYTHEMARTILGTCGVIPRTAKFEDALDYFSHANTVKCSVNKRDKGEAPQRLFTKCRGYLRGEIDVLSPDIIITQGKRAKGGVESAFYTASEWGVCQTIKFGKRKEVLWLPIHHPGDRRGNFFKESRDWGTDGRRWVRFAQEVREFISQR